MIVIEGGRMKGRGGGDLENVKIWDLSLSHISIRKGGGGEGGIVE